MCRVEAFSDVIKRTSALVLFFDVKIYWRQISLLVGVDMVSNYFASHEHNAYSCKDTPLLLMGRCPRDRRSRTMSRSTSWVFAPPMMMMMMMQWP